MPVPLSESRWTILLMEEIRDAARRDNPRDLDAVEASVGGDE